MPRAHEEETIEVQQPSSKPKQRSSFGLTRLDPPRTSSVRQQEEIEIDNNDHNEPQRVRGRVVEMSLGERSLTRDTFSFLVFSEAKSLATWVAVFVWVVQTVIFSLVAADVIDAGSNNAFKIPPNVEAPVRVTQFIALLVAVLTQDDLRNSLNLMRDGYDQDCFSLFPGAKRTKWTVSVTLRAIQGTLGLFVTFLLVMQSETVLDLLLNFSAMEFVSLLDEAAFALIKQGFAGLRLKEVATIVSKTRYYIGGKKSTPYLKLKVALFLLGAMIGGWTAVVIQQERGFYLCKKVFFQIDDTIVPGLGALSGIYLINFDTKFGGRVTYESQMQWSGGSGEGIARLGYCERDSTWTLSINQDPCVWLATSSETASYDVTTTTSDTWYVEQDGRKMPAQAKYIECYDCDMEENFCGLPTHGICFSDANECQCASDRYGLRCEFPVPCPSLEIDSRSDGFVSFTEFPRNYTRLDRADAYNRPVYYSIGWNQAEVMFFAGRRWALASFRLAGLDDVSSSSATEEILRSYFNTFHARYSNYSASFVSETVDIDSASDIDATPLNLIWYHTTAASDGEEHRITAPDTSRSPIEPMLMCSICDNGSNPCLFDGICSGGTCECAQRSTGTLCQIAPLSDGLCDGYFNRAEYEYDGGDCCESTCKSAANMCGKDGSGFLDIGYDKCHDTKSTWIKSGDTVYGVNSGSTSGASTALGGRDGSILAVGDPGASVVRLFDKVGSEWVLRSQITGSVGSRFGWAVSLSGEADSQTTNRRSSPLVTLAVGADGYARVFRCSTQGCVQVGNDITGSDKFGQTISLSSDGNVVAIGGGYDGPAVFKHDFTSDEWLPFGFLPGAFNYRAVWRDIYPGYYVSLSGDGLKVAIGAISTQCASGGGCYADLSTTVYLWNEADDVSRGLWDRLGSNFKQVEHFVFIESKSLLPLRAVVLSRSGDVLAIGGEKAVDIYEFDKKTEQWKARASLSPAVVLLKTDVPVWSIDLNLDGSTVVVTSSDGLGTQSEDSIGVYRWNGKEYLEQQLPAQSAGEVSSVALSNDGKSLAIGVQGNQGGSTSYYKFLEGSKCGDDSVPLRLSFTADGTSENSFLSWKLYISTGEVIENEPYELFSFSSFVEELCLPNDAWAVLHIYGTVQSPGGYVIFLDDEEYKRDTSGFERFEQVYIGSPVCPQDMSHFSLFIDSFSVEYAWEIQDSTTGQEVFNSGGTNYGISSFAACIPKCSVFSIWDPKDDCGCILSGYSMEYNVTVDETLIESYYGEVLYSEYSCRRHTYIGDCPVMIDGLIDGPVMIDINDYDSTPGPTETPSQSQTQLRTAVPTFGRTQNFDLP